MSNYTQCELVRGKEVEVVWIPTQYGRIGKWLSIKGDKKGDWRVVKIWGTQKKTIVEGRERDYRGFEEVLGKG